MMPTRLSTLIENLQEGLLITPQQLSGRRLPHLDEATAPEQAKAEVIHRFWDVYKQFHTDKHQASAMDVAGLLRQVLRLCQRPMRLRRDLWQQLGDVPASFKLLTPTAETNEFIEVIADDWKADWLQHSERIDRLTQARQNEEVMGDGLIAAMPPQWTTYRSKAQKVAVDTWLFTPPGATTIITLPTGEGKSLCTILPAWFDSQKGRTASGTTIVIVPTVALAHDQQKQARRFFPNTRSDLFQPTSRTGQTGDTARRDIEQAIRDGTLPILYTSPESLLQSKLYDTCLAAARDGLITRFVIDEAHLIETWGAQFRVEFQLLAAYREQLLQASRGRLKTLLLSATISSTSFDTLADLFSEPGRLITLQANRLRSEIEYYFAEAPTADKRRAYVLEAMRFLPRPLILYVTRPQQARRWQQHLRQAGYKRVAAFHGDTHNRERAQLIHEWDDNRIDIMVATSAFGLGVDKRHVRSVVHATLPENLDRLYQEVGRGGRDGCRAISLTCITDEDTEVAIGLKPRRLTLEIAHPRWKAMKETATTHPDNPHILLIDSNAIRTNAATMHTGKENRNWNLHLLLMMERANMLKITGVPPTYHTDDGETISRIPVQILQNDIFNDMEQFDRKFEIIREEERAIIHENSQNALAFVQQYARDKSDVCLAQQLKALYEDAQPICSGCPVCRRPSMSRIYLPEPTRFYLEYPQALKQQITSSQTLDDKLRRKKMGHWQQFTLFWDEATTTERLQQHLVWIVDLMRQGFEQIIYPEDWLPSRALQDEFVHLLAETPAIREHFLHRLLTVEDVINQHVALFALNTLVIYPTSKMATTQLHALLARTDVPYQLNIIKYTQQLKDGRDLRDVLPGISQPLDLYIQEDDDDLPLF